MIIVTIADQLAMEPCLLRKVIGANTNACNFIADLLASISESSATLVDTPVTGSDSVGLVSGWLKPSLCQHAQDELKTPDRAMRWMGCGSGSSLREWFRGFVASLWAGRSRPGAERVGPLNRLWSDEAFGRISGIAITVR